jgi:hypothetical protein
MLEPRVNLVLPSIVSNSRCEERSISDGEAAVPKNLPQSILELAAKGLSQMFLPEKQLFCYTLRREPDGHLLAHGTSHRYTMMTLLGLHRYERAGHPSPIPLGPVLDAFLRDTSWIKDAGDLGLLLWLCAEAAPERLPEVYETVNARNASAAFRDAQQGKTMEFAWLLTGLASAHLAGFRDLPGLAEKMSAARSVLEHNCGDTGVYGHLHRRRSWSGLVRGRIGSFADQVYPTIAFARLWHATSDPRALKMVSRTVESMCNLQQPLGEWCWHFDAITGRVLSRYPVFSVHQHAMAPMMLFAAADATGRDFRHAIRNGLRWISGNNELRADFVEPAMGLVWRCLYLDRNDALADAALRTIRRRTGTAPRERLKVRYECRPYELGWLLYAYAGRPGCDVATGEAKFNTPLTLLQRPDTWERDHDRK